MASGTPAPKFDLETYESPRAPTPYIDHFHAASHSYFAARSDKSSPESVPMSKPSLRHGEPNLLKQATAASAQHDPAAVQHPLSPAKSLSPQEAHPDLQLSGRIISASICIRYAIGFSDQSEWVCPRSFQFPCHEC